MTIELNKRIVRRYFEEVWNRKDVMAIEEIVASQVVGHVPDATLYGIEPLKQRMGMLYTIYSNPHFTVEDQIAEGDKVFTRWIFCGTHTGEFMGVHPTGKQVIASGMNLFRLADGKIVELWLNADDLGELQQLGMVDIRG